MEKRKKLIVVLGPTASGKTALSIQLARALNTEIISADSRQFFAELNIGVARPSREELAAVKHHFIAFLSIEEHYSAGTFEVDALNKLSEIFSSHDAAVCCGGSMLYIDVLLHGLDDLPGDKEVRKRIKQRYNTMGLESLQEELKRQDPEYFMEVDLQNPHRLIRALEVIEVTGKKYSSMRSARKKERPFDVVKIGLNGSREWLYQRINDRVLQMMEAGLEDEARQLYPKRHLNALNTVGYKELFAYFDGACNREEAVAAIQQHSRNFAKRQLTWWRSQDDIHWIDAEHEKQLREAALKFILPTA